MKAVKILAIDNNNNKKRSILTKIANNFGIKIKITLIFKIKKRVILLKINKKKQYLV